MCCLVSGDSLPDFVIKLLDSMSFDLQPSDVLPFLFGNYIRRACAIISRIAEIRLYVGKPNQRIDDYLLDIVSQVCRLDDSVMVGNIPIGENLNLQFWTTYRMATIKLHHFVTLLLSSIDDFTTGDLSADDISYLREQRITSLRKISVVGEEILDTARKLLQDTSVMSNASTPVGTEDGRHREYFPVCWADAHRLIPAISLVAALPSMHNKQRHEAGNTLKIIGLRFRIKQAMISNRESQA